MTDEIRRLIEMADAEQRELARQRDTHSVRMWTKETADYNEALRSAAPSLLSSSARCELAVRALDEIAERMDNYLHAAMLPMSDSLHAVGLKGGVQLAKELASAALAEIEKIAKEPTHG